MAEDEGVISQREEAAPLAAAMAGEGDHLPMPMPSLLIRKGPRRRLPLKRRSKI